MLVIANNSAEINVNPRAEGEWVNIYRGWIICDKPTFLSWLLLLSDTFWSIQNKNILAFSFIKKHQIFFFIKKTSNLFSQECGSISLSLIENKRVIKILDRTVHSFNQIPITQIKSIHLSRACFNEREHGWKYLREEK